MPGTLLSWQLMSSTTWLEMEGFEAQSCVSLWWCGDINFVQLAGIYTPNNGRCMTPVGRGGMYTAGLEQDYPSVSLIRESLREAQIIPLFTVTNAFKLLYDVRPLCPLLVVVTIQFCLCVL